MTRKQCLPSPAHNYHSKESQLVYIGLYCCSLDRQDNPFVHNQYHSSLDRRCTFVTHLSIGHAPSSLSCNRDILSSRNNFHATHQSHSHIFCLHNLSCGLSKACHKQAHCGNRHSRKYGQLLVCQICRVSHKQHPSILAGRCT